MAGAATAVEDVGRREIVTRGHGNVPRGGNLEQRFRVLDIVVGEEALDEGLEGPVAQAERLDTAIDTLLAREF